MPGRGRGKGDHHLPGQARPSRPNRDVGPGPSVVGDLNGVSGGGSPDAVPGIHHDLGECLRTAEVDGHAHADTLACTAAPAGPAVAVDHVDEWLPRYLGTQRRQLPSLPRHGAGRAGRSAAPYGSEYASHRLSTLTWGPRPTPEISSPNPASATASSPHLSLRPCKPLSWSRRLITVAAGVGAGGSATRWRLRSKPGTPARERRRWGWGRACRPGSRRRAAATARPGRG